jgi:fumarate hydratase subunit beta
MSAARRVTLPMSRDIAAGLKLGDMVTLDGRIVLTAGLPTHQRILDGIRSGEPPPLDLDGAAFFHLGSMSREAPEGGLEVLYMNPTTSTRFNPLMPEIIRHFRLACVGGKGGLDAACAAALRDVGGVYLSFLGGGAELHTSAIRRVVRVAWDDLVAHYRLVEMEVAALGPLTVAIDARGASLYDELTRSALDRRQAILARLAVARAPAQRLKD